MMEVFSFTLAFLQNFCLALGALFVFSLVARFLPGEGTRHAVLGLLLGSTLLLSASPVADLKGVVLALAGAIGGPWAAGAALLVAGLTLAGNLPQALFLLLSALAGVGFFLPIRKASPLRELALLAGLGAAVLAGASLTSFSLPSLGVFVTTLVGLTGLGLLVRVLEDSAAGQQKLRQAYRKWKDLASNRAADLETAETSHRLVLDSLHDAVFVYDLNGVIVDVNQKVLELYEIKSREQVLGTSPLDYTDPDVRPDPALDPRAEPPPGTTVTFDWHCRTLETNRKFTAQVDLKRTEYQGRPHLLAVVRDVSANKASQEKMAELTSLSTKLQTAAKAAQMGIWDWDIETEELIWDETMRELYGTPPSDQRGYQMWATSLHPEDKQAAEQELRSALEGEHDFNTEFRIVRPDGGLRHIRASGQVLRDSSGKAVRMVGINYDITERIAAQRELLNEKNLAQQYLDVVEDILVGLDDSSEAILLNRKGCQVLGWELSELRGKDWFKTVVPPERYSYVSSIYRGILSGADGPEFYESEIVTRSGERRQIAWHSTPIRDGNRIVGILSSGDDITERRKAQRQLDLYSGHLEELVNQRTVELEAARDAANSANHAKSLFLANMSHEIRTPMNAVLGFAQLLAKEPGLSDTGLHKVSTIIKNGEHLLAIINDILEMSRIEAGRLDLKTNAFDLHELLGDLAQQFGQRAGEKGLVWVFDKAEALPRLVRSDSVRLRQILINLLGNAVKFTESGSIRFRAEPAGPGRIAIEVSDTGIGIPAEERARLFQPFERTRSGKEVAGGTGLGLAISRRYALLMGGDITIADTEGTSFRLEIAAPTEDSAVPRTDLPLLPQLEEGHRGTLVLVADDLKSNRELLRGMLEPQGFVVIEAVDGADAVALVRTRSPRIVLMDLWMPGLDGFQATLMIREQPTSQRPTIIGVSASAFEQERSHFESSGLDGFLAKPFRFQELHDLISRLTGIPYLAVEPVVAESTGPDTPLPSAWARAFSGALAQGNVTKLRQLGESAQEFNSGLSSWISERVSRYELDELRRFLAKVAP